MYKLLLLCTVLSVGRMLFAVELPDTWPPAWAGTTHGGAEGVNTDDHNGFDYGVDSWGPWANLEIKDALGGNVVARIEMRYIKKPVAYDMGAPENEQGARVTEKPRVHVPAGDLNGGDPFWISASECTQELWEEVHKLRDPGFAMRLKKRNNSDIADLETAAFPIDVESFPKSDFITESGYPIDLDGAVNVDNWEGLAEAAFRPAFETSKAVRAIESQTFVNCKDFCEDALKAAVDNSYAITTEIRLPTEQEWEYVCRAGTQTAFWCGRLLSGVDVELVGPSISKVDFWASFDKDDLIAKIPDLPGGDESSGGRHKEWYSNRAKYLKFVSIDIDGVGHVFWHDWYATIGGELVVDGGSLNASKVVANFDEHYQHRYRADFYGTHTPILMIYELIDATNLIYEARPYADPTAADMYYKIMDRDEYILTTDLSLANTYVFEQYVFTHEDRWTVPKLHPGDWYTEGGVGEPVQLEYREMVPVYARYDGTGLRTKDGAYVKDFDGSLQPLRSLYVPAPYYAAGVYIGSTFPDIDLGTKTIESMVREVDLSDVAGVRMDTDDYILAFKQAVAAGILGKKYDPGFYSGPQKPKTVQMPGTLLDIKFQDEIEITVNTPPVDNSKITFERQVRNPWGLLSVHGNVAEWVDRSWDGRSSHALHKAGDYVITRGGSWKTGADICRSAARIACDPDQAYDDVGFRFIIND